LSPTYVFLFILHPFVITLIQHSLPNIWSSPWHHIMFYCCYHDSISPQPREVFEFHILPTSSICTNHSTPLQVNIWYHIWSIDFKKNFAPFHHCCFHVDLNKSFQEGGSILALITLQTISLGRDRESHHFSMLLLTPLIFDINRFYITMDLTSQQR